MNSVDTGKSPGDKAAEENELKMPKEKRKIIFGEDSVRTFMAPDPDFYSHGSGSGMLSVSNQDESVFLNNADSDVFASLPPSPRFMVKRQVSPHGERILTSLNEVCRKMEILAVLPQIMSRICLGDMELENTLGVECTSAILELLYIQMHWIEVRNGGGAPFKYMMKTIEEVRQKLLQQYSFQGQGAYRKKKRKHDCDLPLPEISESYKLRSIRLLTANYNMGNAMVMDMPSIGPELFGIEKDKYMADRLKAANREVLRLLCLNEYAMTYVGHNLKTQVTQAVKIFYTQIQVLQGLMYARLLITPEEEIKRIQILKQTWIREQRLHNLYSKLEVEYNGLTLERSAIMEKLNVTINQYITQIDVAFQQAHHEINRISGDGAKKDLINAKAFDQDLQQLDGTYQRALKFATSMRFKLNDEETKLRKRRFKMEAELEAVIDRYDVEMTARQELLDQLEENDSANKDEISRLEKSFKKIEHRYSMMLEEGRLRELVEGLRNKKKKKKKGKKGKKGKGKKGGKGKGKKGKEKGKGKKKGKGKAKVGGRKEKAGGKKGGKRRKKGSTKDGDTTTDYETVDEDEGSEMGDEFKEENEELSPKRAKGKATKNEKEAKSPKSKSKSPKGAPKKAKGKGKGKFKEEKAAARDGKQEKVGAKDKGKEKGKGRKSSTKLSVGGINDVEEEEGTDEGIDSLSNLLNDDKGEDEEWMGEDTRESGVPTPSTPEVGAVAGKKKGKKKGGKKGKKGKSPATKKTKKAGKPKPKKK